MLSIPSNAPIFLCGSSISLRNGFEGLAAAADNLFGNETPSEAYFIFINRRRTRIKILHKSEENLSIWFIRSRNGVFVNGCLVNSLITQNECYSILKGEAPNHLICPKNTS
jgi:hypothetical protein